MTSSSRSRRERADRDAALEKLLSELARKGLLGRPEPDEVAEPESFYGFEPLPPRGQAVSNELIDRLREEEPE